MECLRIEIEALRKRQIEVSGLATRSNPDRETHPGKRAGVSVAEARMEPPSDRTGKWDSECRPGSAESDGKWPPTPPSASVAQMPTPRGA